MQETNTFLADHEHGLNKVNPRKMGNSDGKGGREGKGERVNVRITMLVRAGACMHARACVVLRACVRASLRLHQHVKRATCLQEIRVGDAQETRKGVGVRRQLHPLQAVENGIVDHKVRPKVRAVRERRYHG